MHPEIGDIGPSVGWFIKPLKSRCEPLHNKSADNNTERCGWQTRHDNANHAKRQ
jgi:hypothetical protein